MVLKQFISLGEIDNVEKISKTQPCYKEDELEGERIFPANKIGQKKKPSSGKKGEHPREYWNTSKPKKAPTIDNSYNKKGVEVGPKEVQKAVIAPVKPKVFKGPRKLGNKPLNIDLDFSKVCKRMAKHRPDLDFSMVEELVATFWPTLIGIGLGTISAMSKDPIAEYRERERLAKIAGGKK